MSILCAVRWFGPATLRVPASFCLLALAMTAVPAATNAQQDSDTTRQKTTRFGPVTSETVAAAIRVPTRFQIQPEHQRELDRLGNAVRNRIREFGAALARDRFNDFMENRWKQIVRDARREDASVDVEALVQAVLREAYLETVRDQRSHVDRVRFFNDLKRRVREEIRRARGETEGSSRYLRELEDLLQEIGHDAQLANLDLQNALQRHQQAMQMISNLSRLLHESAMAVIRNMRG